MKRLAWLIPVLVLAGCIHNNGVWRSAYQKARMIPDPQERCAAMAKVAEAAACVGDVSTTKYALAEVRDEAEHDAAADRCAIQLGNAGYAVGAVEVANLVHDPDKRKAARAKVGL